MLYDNTQQLLQVTAQIALLLKFCVISFWLLSKLSLIFSLNQTWTKWTNLYTTKTEKQQSHISMSEKKQNKKTVQTENSICTTLNAQFQQATDHFISFFY